MAAFPSAVFDIFSGVSLHCLCSNNVSGLMGMVLSLFLGQPYLSALASDSLLNTITSPVNSCGALCLRVKMATLDLDVNSTYLIFRGQ